MQPSRECTHLAQGQADAIASLYTINFGCVENFWVTERAVYELIKTEFASLAHCGVF